MSLSTDLKKTATGTGEALVGIVDLAVEKVRDARGQVAATRHAITHIDPIALQKELFKQVQEAPSVAIRTANELIGKVQSDVESTVGSLEARGDSLLTRLRTQRATKDLVKQVDTTIAVGRGAVTTARHAVDSTTSSAKATFTTARKEAVKTADTIVETVKDDVDEVKPEVKAAAKRTRTAAKRTTTTARKGAERTTTRAKATRTTAKKATAAAAKATEDGAAKVGD
jgi:heparin binding hemagglutinin HbhA